MTGLIGCTVVLTLSLRGAKRRGNPREVGHGKTLVGSYDWFPEISGLALRFCPALYLCKTKCLPSRRGRLTPPQAALPCGPRHSLRSFLAMTGLVVRTAVPALSLRGAPKGRRGNLREPVLRTNCHYTATNIPKITGLALRFCPALCLCKTKCLPSRSPMEKASADPA